MKIMDSSRLSYRLLTAEDAELLFELDQDEEVMRFINGGKKTTRDELKNVFIPRMESYLDKDKGWGLWMLTVRETGHYIGWVLVRPMNFFNDKREEDNLEIGWRLKQKAWGRGYATEAAMKLRDALIDDPNVNKLTAIAFEENLASTNVMKKIGMKFLKKDLHRDPLGDHELVFYELDVKSSL